MKRCLILIFTLVLTTALFTACGCTGKNAEYTTLPTTMPTMETVIPTAETTHPTESTIDRGNGPLETTRETRDNTTESSITDKAEPTVQ